MNHDCRRMSGYIKTSTFEIVGNEASFFLEWHSPKQRHADFATRIYTSDVKTACEAVGNKRRVYITAVKNDGRHVATVFKIIE